MIDKTALLYPWAGVDESHGTYTDANRDSRTNLLFFRIRGINAHRGGENLRTSGCYFMNSNLLSSTHDG